MRRMILLPLALALFGTVTRADEVLVSTTPVAVRHDAPARYELTALGLYSDPPRIVVQLTAKIAGGECARIGSECQRLEVSYDGEPARTMLEALNSANLSIKSLRRRVLERLQADGYLPAGAISGTAGGIGPVTPTASPTATSTATPRATETPASTATATP